MNKAGMDALVHDLRNEFTSVLLTVELKHRTKEIPDDLRVLFRKRISNYLEKIDLLTGSIDAKEHITVSHEELSSSLGLFCEKNSNGLFHHYSHSFKGETRILLESLATLGLIVGEIFRNAAQAGSTAISVHVSDTKDLIKIYFKDNGSGISADAKDQMEIPKSTRGHGGEGTKLLKDLAFNCGGAISWHSAGRGTMVRLLLQKAN
jgi:two-component sensor histidine kinase